MNNCTRLIVAAMACTALLLLSGCTEADIARAQAVVDQSSIQLDRAEKTVALAEKAVATARALAEASGNESALRVVDQATSALATARTVRDGLATTVESARSALDTAKAVQAAGGSTVDVLIAVAGTAVPALGVVLGILRKLWDNRRALQQTVEGITEARKTMPAEVWDTHMAPALSSSQDADVKARVLAMRTDVEPDKKVA